MTKMTGRFRAHVYDGDMVVMMMTIMSLRRRRSKGRSVDEQGFGFRRRMACGVMRRFDESDESDESDGRWTTRCRTMGGWMGR